MLNVDSFLTKMGTAPKLTNIYETAIRFQNEMRAGLEGKHSSLPMIPSYIGEAFPPVAGEFVIGIDAGGTNLRISLIQFNTQGMPEIKEIKHHPMPGTTGQITSDDFFDFLATELEEFLEITRKIGFCFTYLVEILPSRDGKIFGLGKEVEIVGCEGKVIGEELSKALCRKGLPNFTQITVLDDTTASLIAGKCLCKDQDYADVVAYILGTGTNLCYYEKNEAITKSPFLSGKTGRTIINVESGCFDGQVRGSLDLEFWAETLHPESHHAEKMIGGQYLGDLLEKYFMKAVDYSLFSDKGAELIRSLKKIETKDISNYFSIKNEWNPFEKIEVKDDTKNIEDFFPIHHADNPLGTLRTLNHEDLEIANALIVALIERAAKLVVSSILGCLMQISTGKDPNRPVLILVEGSTFFRFTTLQERILHYVKTEIRKKQGYHVVFKELEHTVLLGTAYAATLE